MASELVRTIMATSHRGVIEDPPGECSEYYEGYYATFFRDPDGLKYEFVINPDHGRKRKLREAGAASVRSG